MNHSDPIAKRMVDIRIWMLAMLNLIVAGLVMQYLTDFVSHNHAGSIRIGLIHAQTVLLALCTALLAYRAAYGVFVILLLAGLLSLLSASSPVQLDMLETAMPTIAILALLHGFRLCFGERITREPAIEQRAGQFQTLDLLEWTFTVASALGIASWCFSRLEHRPTSEDLVAGWIYVAIFTLLGVPLARVLLNERLKLGWFCAVVLLWIAVNVGVLGFESWRLTNSIWPNQMMMDFWLSGTPAFLVCFALTTALNSLALRFFGYRWRNASAAC